MIFFFFSPGILIQLWNLCQLIWKYQVEQGKLQKADLTNVTNFSIQKTGNYC